MYFRSGYKEETFVAVAAADTAVQHRETNGNYIIAGNGSASCKRSDYTASFWGIAKSWGNM